MTRSRFLLSCLIGLLAALYCTLSHVQAQAQTQLIDQAMLDFINSNPDHGWKAVKRVRDSPFAGWSDERARNQLFMSKVNLPPSMWEALEKQRKEEEFLRQTGNFPKKIDATTVAPPTANDLPAHFDSRDQWPGCIHSIRDQGNCGSCYSFASSGLLSDRFCIHSNGTYNVLLSAQDLVSCSSLTFGCNGGLSQAVFYELEKYGIVPDECLPYTSGSTGKGGSCPKNVTCFGREWTDLKQLRFKVKSYSHIGKYFEKTSSRAEAIQRELVQNGPVDALFNVYADFSSYSSGVYRHVTGGFKGIHAVRVIGYGVDNASGLPYWLVANSWGTRWGDKGYFKILRGEDTCGIELMVYAGMPDIANAPRL